MGDINCEVEPCRAPEVGGWGAGGKGRRCAQEVAPELPGGQEGTPINERHTANEDNAPASRSTLILNPAFFRAETPWGVSATRRSLSKVSFGTPVVKHSRHFTVRCLMSGGRKV